jgi:acyl carrier protein
MTAIPTEFPADFAELLRPFLRFAADAPIGPDADLRRLGLDSMQAIELLFAIEDEFGVTLADDLLTDATFQTAGSLWAALRRSQGAAIPSGGAR